MVRLDDAQGASRKESKTPAGVAKAERGLEAFRYDQAVRGEYGALLCGVDEAGRGPLAGPVVASAVVLPGRLLDVFIYDSKQMTRRQREAAYAVITREAVAWGVGVVDREYIDQYNILQATYEAMRRAVEALRTAPELVLVDGAVIPGLAYPQRRLVKGDSVSQSIGAASVIAKVTRDEVMRDLDQTYPVYGFSRNMGYGTAEHLEALRVHGPCPAHRRSFAPVRQATEPVGRPPRDVRRFQGMSAEDAAWRYLQADGYTLLERNWRCAFGEIDMVAVKEDVLAFVEVRSRRMPKAEQALAAAGESVDAKKRRRLVRLAEWFMAERQLRWPGVFRFDAILVGGDGRGARVIEHVTDAW